MTVVYAKLEVSLHSLEADSAEEIAARVKASVARAFPPGVDVEVEVVESAGSVE